MNESIKFFVGPDVHKDPIAVAVAEAEAIRDLARAREDAVNARTQAPSA